MAVLLTSAEERVVDAVASGLGMRRVGFIFTQTLSQGKLASEHQFTMTASEVLLAAQLHAEALGQKKKTLEEIEEEKQQNGKWGKESVKGEQGSEEKPAIEPFKHFAIVVVKLDFPEEDDEDGDEADASNGEVHFEAFQLSDQCIKLYVDGWFDEEWEERKKESAEARRKGKGPAGKEEFKEEDDDPKVSHMRKDVIVERKDTKVVDNDFFLMPVKIEDHEVWRVEPLYRLRWIGRIEPCNALVHPC